MSDEVVYRPLNRRNKGEIGFVLKSWIRSFARSQYAGPYTRRRLARVIKETIVDLLERGAQVTVAAWAEDPELILGFCCYETGYPWPVVHYVYVKGPFRERGIGSDLVALARGTRTGKVRYTHKTRDTKWVLREAEHTPSLARYPRRQGQG